VEEGRGRWASWSNGPDPRWAGAHWKENKKENMSRIGSGLNGYWAVRENENGLEISMPWIWIWKKYLGSNWRYFQIQMKFKPSQQIEIWYFWKNMIFKLKQKFKSRRF
jgi:hypothetical protein